MVSIQRRLAVAGLAFLLAGSMAACSGAPSPSGSPAGLTGTLRVWNPYPEMYDPAMAGVAKAYEASHEGVTIELESVPFDGSTDALQTQFLGSSAPDLMLLEPPVIIDFAGRGYLRDITDAVDEEWRAGFAGTSFDSLRGNDGKVYALPNAFIHVKTLNRPDVFEAAGITTPPVTMTDEIESWKKLRAAGVTPYAFPTDQNSSFWWRFVLLLNASWRPLTEQINLRHADGWSYDYTKADSVAGESYTTDEKYVAFMNGLTDPAKSETYRDALELVMKYRDAVADPVAYDGDDKIDVASGKIGSAIGTDGEITGRIAEAKEAGYDIALTSRPLAGVTATEFPALTNGPTNPLAMVRNGWAVNSEVENPQLALDFARFLTTADGQNVFFANGADAKGKWLIGQASAVKGVTYPTEIGLVDEEVKLIPELSVYGFGWPAAYDAKDMDEWNKQFYSLWIGKTDVDTFLQERSKSNLAGLERQLKLEADQIDQAFIDANVKK